MMRFVLTALLGASFATLAACGSDNELPGRGYMPPSDVTASRTVPLTVPPDFGLRPDSEKQAESRTVILADTVAGSTVDVAALDATLGEQDLLVKAGVLNANPTIRQLLNRENAMLIGNDALVDTLLFGNHPTGSGVEVTEGPEVGPDVAIEQSTPVDDDSWVDSVLGIF